MCGRFTLQYSAEMLQAVFGISNAPALQPRYNISPTQTIAAVRQDSDGHNQLFMAHWGLIPSWAKDTSIGNHTINARSETIQEKPAFRSAIKYRRCIIPASGFFEWRHEGKHAFPQYIRMKNQQPMYFAGIWEHWQSAEGEELESCSIITTSSNSLIRPLHERMPVLLQRNDFSLWLNRAMHDPGQVNHLFLPCPADLLEMYPVSTLVNSPRHDIPECIERQGASTIVCVNAEIQKRGI